MRRSWLAVPTCDPRRITAAAVGGRPTCLTAAAIHGLWTPPHADVHVALPRNASRFDPEGVIVHWSAGPVPLARWSTDEHPLNLLCQVARCLPRGEALAVWESALRKHLVDSGVLSLVRWPSPGARELAGIADSLSDSGMETRFVVLMRSIGVAVRQQVWIDGHPLDGLIGERLAVQLDGFAHHSDAQARRRDLRADARLALRGYTVLRFDYEQVFFDPEHVRGTILTAIAQGLHRVRR